MGRARRQPRDSLLEPRHERLAREAAGEGDAVAHGARRQSTVADETEPVHAEQRRAAELRRIDPARETPEGRARERRAQTRRRRRAELLAQHAADGVDHAFADLERDVAGEAVADDHVGIAVEQVVGFDVAGEVQAAGLEGSETRPASAGRPSALPRQSTAGRRAAPAGRVRPARRRSPSRRTGAGAPAGSRRWRRRRAAPRAPWRSGSSPRARANRRRPASRARRRPRQRGAGVPGAEQPRHLPRAHALDGDADRRGALAQGVAGTVGHADPFGSVHEGERKAGPIRLAGQAGLELGDRADERESRGPAHGRRGVRPPPPAPGRRRPPWRRRPTVDRRAAGRPHDQTQRRSGTDAIRHGGDQPRRRSIPPVPTLP